MWHTAIPALLVLAAANPAWSKSPTTKIVIEGKSLPAPITITDPSTVEHFSIWHGPLVRMNGQPVHPGPDSQSKTFINWPKGRVDMEPSGLRKFRVSFHLDHSEEHTYVVKYAFDPANARGFMYLPGIPTNTGLIYHGVEGNWFYSSDTWESLVRPLIE